MINLSPNVAETTHEKLKIAAAPAENTNNRAAQIMTKTAEAANAIAGNAGPARQTHKSKWIAPGLIAAASILTNCVHTETSHYPSVLVTTPDRQNLPKQKKWIAEQRIVQKKAVKTKAEIEAEEDQKRIADEEKRIEADDAIWKHASVDECRFPSTEFACDGVQIYLNKVPNGRHTAEAQALMAESTPALMEKKRQREDAKAKEAALKQREADRKQKEAQLADARALKEAQLAKARALKEERLAKARELKEAQKEDALRQREQAEQEREHMRECRKCRGNYAGRVNHYGMIVLYEEVVIAVNPETCSYTAHFNLSDKEHRNIIERDCLDNVIINVDDYEIRR